jgi:hypothetical protein
MTKLDSDAVDVLNDFFNQHQRFSFEASQFDKRLFCRPDLVTTFSSSVASFFDESYEAAAQYYDVPVADLKVLLLLNEVASSEGQRNPEGSGGGFHTDSVLSKQIKTFAYLSDVLSVGDGALTVTSFEDTAVAHALNLVLTGKINNRFEHSVVEAYLEKRAKPILGKRGSTFTCDTRVAHRGQPVRARHPRRMATIYMYKSDSPAFRRLAKMAAWA